ncbi:MAG: hypothetical protein K9H26_01285 [Prolixibacteraceae bacterium]|nr:hypothetical protein [Prolixibacteraceae bacterium]
MDKKIRFIHNDEVDLIKWDNAINSAPNSRIYALSWYLDILNPDWHAIVFGNYEYVMPVILAKKMGIDYAYQPLFAQQHGIFPPAIPEISTLFFFTLKKQLRYFDISVNSFNLIDCEHLDCEKRNNYLLSLNHNYGEIRGSFSTHCKRNLKKAAKYENLPTDIGLADFLKLKKEAGKGPVSTQAIGKLQLIISHALDRGACFIRGAFTKNNELIAAAVFLKHKERIIYLNAVSSETGREYRSMYVIINSVIEEHAGKHLYLDFEGSNIESIARFFAGFGAQPETYLHVKYNNLPPVLKLFKK